MNVKMILIYKKILLPIFILGFPLLNFAQTNFDNYTPVVSSGTIPQEFRMLYQDKFDEDKSELHDIDKKSERKAKEQYILKSNYYVEQLILSGRVLYNDPVGNYVNKVADELLKSDPELRADLKFYVVKSPIVNAYTTNRGVIFVTMGLIAQLENEAQLAYILAHESIHHKNKHGIEAYVEKDKIENGKDQYRWHTKEDKILSMSGYSKELEFEADEQGLDEYLKTNYDITTLNGVFDVLQYADLPFDDVAFDKTFFETPYMKFPDSYFLDQEKEIKGEDDADDSESSHPNVKRRRNNIQNKIEELKNDGKQKFIVSETEFNNAREIARFELSRMYTQDQQYAKSIYNSYLLLKKYPNNIYLEKNVMKGLYLLTKYKNEGLFSDVHEGYEKIEGSSQQLYHLLSKLSSVELNSVALHYAWKTQQKYPNDKYISDITSDLLRDLIVKHDVSQDDYNRKAKDELKQELSANLDSLQNKKSESKYDKIKKKKTTEKVEKEDKFISYVFVDLFADHAFKSAFDDMIEKSDAEKREKEKELTDDQESEKRKQENIEKKKGKALGIDKVVVVDPYYVKIDQRKDDQIQYISTANSQLSFSELLADNAKIANLDIDVLNPKTFADNDEEKYNDFSSLNEWIDEQAKINEDLESDVVYSDSAQMTPIIDRYGTNHFLWTGVLTARKSNNFNYENMYYVCLSAIYFPLLPFTLYYILKPHYQTAYYTYLVDISDGKVELSDGKYFYAKDRTDLMNSFVYDNMFQMKAKRKTKNK